MSQQTCAHVFRQGKNANSQCLKNISPTDPSGQFCSTHKKKTSPVPVPGRGKAKAKDGFSDIRDLDDIPEEDEEDPEPQGWSGKDEEQEEEEEPESADEQDAGPPGMQEVLADISDELAKILRISDVRAMKRAIQGLQQEIRDVSQ
jgi:hypothetical protein